MLVGKASVCEPIGFVFVGEQSSLNPRQNRPYTGEQPERIKMKSIFEELGGTYHNEGDYLIPDIVAPEAPHIGVWGRERKHYLQQYHDSIYTALLLSGKLNAHLEEIDRSANEMFDLLMKQYADREGVTEQLKAQDQMEWVRHMNSIRARIEEVIHSELIYA